MNILNEMLAASPTLLPERVRDALSVFAGSSDDRLARMPEDEG